MKNKIVSVYFIGMIALSPLLAHAEEHSQNNAPILVDGTTVLVGMGTSFGIAGAGILTKGEKHYNNSNALYKRASQAEAEREEILQEAGRPHATQVERLNHRIELLKLEIQDEKAKVASASNHSKIEELNSQLSQLLKEKEVAKIQIKDAKKFITHGEDRHFAFMTASEADRLRPLSVRFYSPKLNVSQLKKEAGKELGKADGTVILSGAIGLLSFFPSTFATQKLIDISKESNRTQKAQASSQADSSNASASASASAAVAIK